MKQILVYISVVFVFGCNKSSDSFSAAPNPTGQGGSMARFTIVDDYLYAVDKQNLKVFDISSPSTPVFKKSVPVGFEIETIFPFAGKLFLGSTTSVHIVSLADPANPVKLSEAISPTVMRRCDPVVAKDSVAYATLRANGSCGGVQSILAVFDIRSITQPVQVEAIPVSEPYGLGYAGNTLYVCDGQLGLLVFDISNEYNPVLVRQIPGVDARDVIPYQSTLICWTTSGMSLYDISDPLDPSLLIHIN
ncbi:MAG TPA: hypothetical protein VFZ78_03890 [Flavisolibacter sp.]